jgi:hypothetical protein
VGNDRGFPLIISTQLEIALIWEERLLFEVVIVARIVLKGSVGFGSGLGGDGGKGGFGCGKEWEVRIGGRWKANFLQNARRDQ